MAALLEIDSIIKSFGGRKLLSDIALQCRPGDIIGLLGRNGTGKSSLLKIIFGRLSAETKFIRINGEVWQKPFLNGKLIHYLPQAGLLPPGLRLEQAFALYGLDARLLQEDEFLAKLGKEKIAELSEGKKRYAEIKLLLHGPASFVLLDEPFTGISPLVVESVCAMIRRAAAHKGILLTDHDYRNVLAVANSFYLLHDGGLRQIKNKSELVDWGYIPASGR